MLVIRFKLRIAIGGIVRLDASRVTRVRRVRKRLVSRFTPPLCLFTTHLLLVGMDSDEDIQMDEVEKDPFPSKSKGKGKASEHEEAYDNDNLPWYVF